MPQKNLSDAQLAANRENAKKSTGPRTLEGKLRSSMNAYKHGITSNRVVLDEESKPAFENMLSNYRTRFQPVDGYESGLVDTLVVIHWHMDRVRYFESAYIQLELTRPGTEEFFEIYPLEIRAGIAYKVLADNTNLLPLFNNHLNRLSREYSRVSRVFLDMRKEMPSPIAPALPDQPASEDCQPDMPLQEMPVENEPTESAPQSRFFSQPIAIKTGGIVQFPTTAAPPLARAA